jgi:hypothetical protein
MADTLGAILENIQDIRSSFRLQGVSDFVNWMNADLEVKSINELEYFFTLIQAIIAERPRADIYKVQSDLPLTSSTEPWRKVLSYGKFCSPWVMEVQFPGGGTVLVLHCVHSDMHYFAEISAVPGVEKEIYCGIFSYNTKTEIWICSEGEEENCSLMWIIGLFRMMQTRKYIDVLGGVRKKKNRLNRCPSNVATNTLHLNEAGKRYQAQHQLATANTTWKNGKEQMAIDIGTFPRRQRVGKGRQEVKTVYVRSHERKQWVVPKDKITKLIA